MLLLYNWAVRLVIAMNGGECPLEVSILAVQFLGIVSVVAIIGIVLCTLAVLGYNAYIKIQDKNKKIEVCAKDTNSKNDSYE